MARPNANKARVVRLFIFVFLLLGPAAALLYYGWTDRALDKAMIDHGVETKATITNAVIRYGKHNSKDYLIDFSWRDAAKRERAIKGTSVSSEVWNRLVSGNKLIVTEIPIKYLESDTESHAILVGIELCASPGLFNAVRGAVLALLGGAILVMGLRSKPALPAVPRQPN